MLVLREINMMSIVLLNVLSDMDLFFLCLGDCDFIY